MEKRKKMIGDLLIYCFFAILMVIVVSHKVNMNIDETLSFGLANSQNSMSMRPVEYYKYEPASQVYDEFFSVPLDGRFNYDLVWRNQAGDVHPPLFYALLHTICSLFPGEFSMWFGTVINIVFQLIALYFVRKITISLTENKFIQVIVSFAYIFSSGILFLTAFIRMYVMAMSQIAMINYVILKDIKDKNRFFAVKLMAVAVFGAMTHYYCIIYTVLICAAYALIKILEKNYNRLIELAGVAAASGLISVAIFPAMIQHIFGGYRGKQSFENAVSDLSVHIQKIKWFVLTMDNDIFGGYILLFVIAIIVLVVACIKSKKASVCAILKKAKLYAVILVPSFVFLALISIIAVMQNNRYTVMIYPMILICIICALEELIVKTINKKLAICLSLGILIFITIGSHSNVRRNYLYKHGETVLAFAEEHTEMDTLYISEGSSWKTRMSILEVSKYKSVTFVDTENENYLENTDFSNNDELIVFSQSEDADVVNYIMQQYPQFTEAECIGSYGYTTTYYLH